MHGARWMDVFEVQKRLGMCYKSGEIKSRLVIGAYLCT